eukprot:4925289-Amphidinium_carterae.1
MIAVEGYFSIVFPPEASQATPQGQPTLLRGVGSAGREKGARPEFRTVLDNYCQYDKVFGTLPVSKH